MRRRATHEGQAGLDVDAELNRSVGALAKHRSEPVCRREELSLSASEHEIDACSRKRPTLVDRSPPVLALGGNGVHRLFDAKQAAESIPDQHG